MVREVQEPVPAEALILGAVTTREHWAPGGAVLLYHMVMPFVGVNVSLGGHGIASCASEHVRVSANKV